MNFLFAIEGYKSLRAVAGVIKALHQRGHRVWLTAAAIDGDVAAGVLLKEISGCYTTIPFAGRERGLIRSLLIRLRWVLTIANYLRKGHPTEFSSSLVSGLLAKAPVSVRRLFACKLLRGLLGSRGFRQCIRMVEAVISVVPLAKQQIESNAIDVVVAAPAINFVSPEIEYIKAGHRVGALTVALVSSWDNPTTKGTFSLQPDQIIVWNKQMKREIVSFHDNVQEETVQVAGALIFDVWFESTHRNLDRAEFLTRAGLRDGQDYVLFLGGSPMVEEYEIPTVCKLADRLMDRFPDGRVTLLVRPHPSRVDAWKKIHHPNLLIFPKCAKFPHGDAAIQDFANSICHSVAVIGMNTTAQIEGAILDKPSVMLLLKENRAVQLDYGHMTSVLDWHFLEIARSIDDCVAIVAKIYGGVDLMIDQRRQFVADFVRPRGIERPVSVEVAVLLESFVLPRHLE